MALPLRSTIRSRAKEAESVEDRIRVGGQKAKALMAAMSEPARAGFTGQVLVTAGGINT